MMKFCCLKFKLLWIFEKLFTFEILISFITRKKRGFQFGKASCYKNPSFVNIINFLVSIRRKFHHNRYLIFNKNESTKSTLLLLVSYYLKLNILLKNNRCPRDIELNTRVIYISCLSLSNKIKIKFYMNELFAQL